MATLKNRAGVLTSTVGTGTITLGSGLTAAQNPNAASWQTFGAAGVVNGDVIRYLILDSNGAWEYGPGTYSSAGLTLSRATGAMDGTIAGQKSSTSALLSLTGTAQVFITAIDADIVSASMSSTSPTSPKVGDLWYNPTTGAVSFRVDTGTGQQWVQTTPIMSDVPPTSPVPGNLWWETDTGILWVYYNDGTSAQWVEAGGEAGLPFALNEQRFTTPGVATYVPSPGTLYCIVEAVGGGGGGGGAYGANTDQFNLGGGGGSGAYSRRLLTAAQIGASQTVTIGAAGVGGTGGTVPGTGGAGGDTSVGILVVAKGGTGGGGTGGGSLAFPGAGGSGAAGTGTVTASGAPGGGGMFGSGSVFGVSNEGGSSVFGGGGGLNTFAANITNGADATNYGSGGSGAVGYNGAGRVGGNGSAGIVIITEYGSAPGFGVALAPVPAGTLVLISSQTVSSAVASVDFTSGIDATYDEYELRMFGVKPSTTANLYLRISQDGGATWKSAASSYSHARIEAYTSNSGAFAGGADTGILLSVNAISTATAAANFVVRFASPSVSGVTKYFMGECIVHGTTAINRLSIGGAYVADTNAIDGLRLSFSTGNITGGTFNLYGVKK